MSHFFFLLPLFISSFPLQHKQQKIVNLLIYFGDKMSVASTNSEDIIFFSILCVFFSLNFYFILFFLHSSKSIIFTNYIFVIFFFCVCLNFSVEQKLKWKSWKDNFFLLYFFLVVVVVSFVNDIISAFSSSFFYCQLNNWELYVEHRQRRKFPCKFIEWEMLRER